LIFIFLYKPIKFFRLKMQKKYITPKIRTLSKINNSEFKENLGKKEISYTELLD